MKRSFIAALGAVVALAGLSTAAAATPTLTTAAFQTMHIEAFQAPPDQVLFEAEDDVVVFSATEQLGKTDVGLSDVGSALESRSVEYRSLDMPDAGDLLAETEPNLELDRTAPIHAFLKQSWGATYLEQEVDVTDVGRISSLGVSVAA